MSQPASAPWMPVREIAAKMLQHLRDVPLDRRLVDCPNLSDQPVDVRHEPARLLTQIFSSASPTRIRTSTSSRSPTVYVIAGRAS